MTIILDSNAVGKSKETLLKALIEAPQAVLFHDLSVFAERHFTGVDVKLGEKFAVVMDHPKRTRFALVTRVRDGSFRVS